MKWNNEQGWKTQKVRKKCLFKRIKVKEDENRGVIFKYDVYKKK
jgi:hypothetical protein